MIRLGLRLTFGGGREAALRTLVTAAAVALGVGLLLMALAGVNGLHSQTQRGAWLDTSQTTPSTTGTSARIRCGGCSASTSSATRPSTGSTSRQRDQPRRSRRDCRICRDPGSTTPRRHSNAFWRRPRRTSSPSGLPDTWTGSIGADGLPSPSSLIIVIGHDPQQLSQVPGAVEVQAMQQTPSSCNACKSGAGSAFALQWILAIGAVALLLPVLILISTASRLSAARREERFAAMRLVAAAPRQISVISAVEATVAAFAGVAFGFLLFFLLRPLLYHVPFTGAPLASGDLSLRPIDVVIVLLGVPIAAVASARLALRRVRISPLGVSRRTTAAPPRVSRVIPLLAGIAFLAYFDGAGKPGSNSGQELELVVGFGLLVVGLVLAGPWFTTAGARLMALRANRPATLIAGRRLLDNPKTAFRFVSGLIIALFITSAAIGALSSIAAASGTAGGSTGMETLGVPLCGFTTSCPGSAEIPSVPSRTLAALRATPGVSGVTVVHDSPQAPLRNSFGGSQGPLVDSFGVVSCNQLAETPAIGKCAPGAATASVGYFFSNVLGHNSHASTTVWPSADLSEAQLMRIPVDAVVVATDGSSGSIERARTSLERAFPFEGTPVTVVALNPSTARLMAAIQDMTAVIIVASLIIAACSLAVNVAAGFGERKRPFSLLRLTGVPLGVLRRVITLESALPLLIVAVVSLFIGLVSAALYLRSQVGIAFQVPGITYWAAVLGGLVASLAIIATTFPLLNRMTGPEVARNN